jgi:hypothetical protein
MPVKLWHIVGAPYQNHMNHTCSRQKTEHADEGQIVAQIPLLAPNPPQDNTENHQEHGKSSENIKNV